MRIRVPPRLVRWVVQPALLAIARTWRIELCNEPRWEALAGSQGPYVLACWHEVLLPVVWQHRHRGIAAVISGARDGEYLAGLMQSLGYAVVRGSSTRGAMGALRGALRELLAGRPVGLTPDGPRGPARQVKPGVAILSQWGGAAIVPVHVQASRAWRLSSWDGFQIPRPFARLRVTYGTPFRVGPGAAGRREGVHATEQALAQLTGASWHDAAISTA